MRTAHLLPVSPSMHCSGGVPARRGGVYLPRYSPTVNRMTDRCKNITLPQTSFVSGKNENKKAFQYDVFCPLADHIPPEGTWYQWYPPPGKELVPEIPT